ncbi:potassium channel subfamily K member 3 [Nematostella vectensis]|uniref:potassium channel subfamily K member 3 n=1 Tax=Nematostella vectensis TaxID=45351 RepID=UPI0020774D3F|nr:potassium channel subfamily K member 3 [Nematostella vectensis]
MFVTFISRLVFRTPVSRHPLRRCLLIGVALVTVFLCIMAVVGMHLDNWIFLDSFYAWFIAFTTIGFGDFVPLENYMQREQGSLRSAFVGVFLAFPYFTGFCVLACLVNLLVLCSEKGYRNVICGKETVEIECEKPREGQQSISRCFKPCITYSRRCSV